MGRYALVKPSAGTSKIRWLKLLSVVFMFSSHHGHGEDFTKALGSIYCDGGIRGIASHITLPENYQNSQSIILTAAHVIYNKQTGKPFKHCFYLPHNRRLSGIAFATISAHSYLTKSTDKIAQAENDIVFVKHKHRAYQPTLSLSQDPINNREKLLLLTINRNNDASFKSWDCQPLYFDAIPQEQLLLHNYPSQSGDSGAPILDNHSGKIIAVHGGKLNLGTNKKQQTGDAWVNQARRTDSSIIKNLQDFLRQL